MQGLTAPSSAEQISALQPPTWQSESCVQAFFRPTPSKRSWCGLSAGTAGTRMDGSGPDVFGDCPAHPEARSSNERKLRMVLLSRIRRTGERFQLLPAGIERLDLTARV